MNLSEIVAQHRSGFAADVVNENCAEEGHVHPLDYEAGIAEMESDPWIYWAVVVGVIGGMLLSL